ncbi:MAG: integrase core domain-containing protein [Planctomycetota bacterium]
MGTREVLIAPQSPWQNPYCEWVIGSIRRDCLDHFIILSDNHLCRILDDYTGYYSNCRTRLSLNRNSPSPRDIEPPSSGKVISIPQVGGLHHLCKRVA